MLIEDKNGDITPYSFIGEFKAIRFLDNLIEEEKKNIEPSEKDKEWMKWYDEHGVDYEFVDGKIKTLNQ